MNCRTNTFGVGEEGNSSESDLFDLMQDVDRGMAGGLLANGKMSLVEMRVQDRKAVHITIIICAFIFLYAWEEFLEKSSDCCKCVCFM